MSETTPIPKASRPSEAARLALSQLPKNAPLPEVFAHICEESAEVLGVERVGIWLLIDRGTVLRCADLYERSKREHSSGAVLRVADFPTFFKALEIRKAVPAEAALTEAWTRELAEPYLRPLGISSLLDAGIFVDTNMVGVVCHERVGAPREWTTEARDFAGSIADLLALRIQSAQTQEMRAAFGSQAKRLAAMEKAEGMQRLAAGMAHDFRNLLTAFLGHGEILATRKDVPEDVRQQGREIVIAADRGIGIAEELLLFATPQSKTPIVADLGAATMGFLPSLRKAVGPRHEVRYSQAGPLGQVLCDTTQYVRVLMNLVINASEAMPGGGTVEVRLAPVRIEGDPACAGRFVLLEVADRGTGMSEEARQRAFEPFYTTKPRGTGLGLAIVRQAVERAGGLVRMEANPGGGTVARAFFPRIGSSTGATGLIVLAPG